MSWIQYKTYLKAYVCCWRFVDDTGIDSNLSGTVIG